LNKYFNFKNIWHVHIKSRFKFSRIFSKISCQNFTEYFCVGASSIYPRGLCQAAGCLCRGQGYGDHQQREGGGQGLDGAPGFRRLQEEEVERYRRLVQVLRYGQELDAMDGRSHETGRNLSSVESGSGHILKISETLKKIS